MKKINLHNYEAYFLDYMEGSLSHEEEHDLMIFLEEHPDLKSELEDDLSDIKLDPTAEIISDKDDLKVATSITTIDHKNIDELMVASVDGTLTETEYKMLEEYVSANHLEKELRLYQATKLKSDTSIIFDKEDLYFDDNYELSSNTIDDWMIASSERQLNRKEEVILHAFAQENGLTDELHSYHSAKLKADLSEQYEDKEELKKKDRVIPLYVRYASIAAAAAIILFFVPLGFNENEKTLSESDAEMNPIEDEVIVPAESFQVDLKTAMNLLPVKKQTTPNKHNEFQDYISATEVEPLVKNNSFSDDEIIEFDSNDLIFLKDLDEFDIVEIEGNQKKKKTKRQKDSEENQYPQNEVAINDNKNGDAVKTEEPFKLLTDVASNALNRDVHFSRDKEVASDEYVAYHFKIGRFEFERKKAR